MAIGSAIRTEGLSKFYGRQRGVENLDLEVGRGEIFGWLGPNGAGKTTTIRMLLNLIRPTGGRASVLGLDTVADSIEVRRRCGYLPGELALYENMTGRAFLGYFAGLRGLRDQSHAHDLAERLDLALDRPIGTLSKGNKQKIGLVQALMHSPPLLILDEPTSGLDPLVQNEVHDVLKEASDAGTTIFLSSHVLSEIEHIAQRVGFIRLGRLAAVEDIATLKRKSVRRMVFHFGSPPPEDAWNQIPGVREASIEGDVGRFVVDGSVDPLLKAASRYEVLDLVSHEPDLEDIFLTYYGDEAREHSS